MKLSDINTSPKRQLAVFTIVGLVAVGILFNVLSPQPEPSKKTTTYRAGQIPQGSIILTKMAGKTVRQGELFRAPLNWDVYWDYVCNQVVSPGYFKITLLGEDLRPSPNLKPVDSAGISGFGDQKYTTTTSMSVLLKVDSNCNWHVTAAIPPSTS